MRRAAGLALALLLTCAAADDWINDVLGPYQGPVMNGGELQQLATDFTLDAQGHLIGHYHVEDTPPFDGDLTDFKPDGPTSGTFVWHDKFGQGIVHVVFEPTRGRFTGFWGPDAPQSGLIFNGYRVRPPAES